MADALEQRVERDARFVSDVSHELRSPLTTLATAADVLEARREDLPDRARTALELVVAEIDRFRSVVEELLELSRAQAAVDPLQLEPVRLGELVLQVTTRSAEAPLVVDVAAGLDGEPVLLDKRRIERVLTNLLDNARVHGGGAVGVAVTCTDGALSIVVDDAGPGVAVADRAAIFERFARGSKAGRRGTDSGTGLGLALVAEHVRLHGGEVWVEDRPAGGARFVVTLPRRGSVA
jgi:signal transduction histidine kinase